MKKTNYNIYCDTCNKLKEEGDEWIMLNYKEFSPNYKEQYIGCSTAMIMMPEYNRVDFCCFKHFVYHFKMIYYKEMKEMKW